MPTLNKAEQYTVEFSSLPLYAGSLVSHRFALSRSSFSRSSAGTPHGNLERLLEWSPAPDATIDFWVITNPHYPPCVVAMAGVLEQEGVETPKEASVDHLDALNIHLPVPTMKK